ncbi:unnamed protein product [Closterium sp. NIES-53]
MTIVGYDMVKEYGKDDPNLVIVHDSLGFGKCHLSIAHKLTIDLIAATSASRVSRCCPCQVTNAPAPITSPAALPSAPITSPAALPSAPITSPAPLPSAPITSPAPLPSAPITSPAPLPSAPITSPAALEIEEVF